MGVLGVNLNGGQTAKQILTPLDSENPQKYVRIFPKDRCFSGVGAFAV
jgi:hypothetical protein